MKRALPILDERTQAPSAPGPEELVLPTLQDTVLNAETVTQLFPDLEALAELLAVVVRRRGDRRAQEPDSTSWQSARDALAGGSAVQLRYRYDGKEWWDTLLPHDRGVRIVRMEQRYGGA